MKLSIPLLVSHFILKKQLVHQTFQQNREFYYFNLRKKTTGNSVNQPLKSLQQICHFVRNAEGDYELINSTIEGKFRLFYFSFSPWIERVRVSVIEIN